MLFNSLQKLIFVLVVLFLLCYPLEMSKFILKEINNADYVKELENIGFDVSYRHKAKEKFVYKNLKITKGTITNN